MLIKYPKHNWGSWECLKFCRVFSHQSMYWENLNFELMMKYEVWKSNYNLSWGGHECLYKISWQFVKWLTRYFSRDHSGGPTFPSLINTTLVLDDLCFMMSNCVRAIAITSSLLRVTLTSQFLWCSWVQRRQSSEWLPPNWSRPLPQSDRSPGSWRRE